MPIVAAVRSVDPDLQVRQHQADPEITPGMMPSVSPVMSDLAVRVAPVPNVVSGLARAVDAVPMLAAVFVTG